MHSLNTKLVLGFLIVSLLGITLAAAYIWRMTTNEFGVFVVHQNQADIVDRLAEVYRAQGSWEGLVGQLNVDPFAPPALGGAAPGSNGPAPGDPARYMPYPRTQAVVVDTDLQVIQGGRGYREGDTVLSSEYERGVPIVVDGREVGRLLLDSKDSGKNRPFERFFMQFYLALGLGALGGTLIALLLGAVLAKSLTSPLRQLTRATQAMSRGDLKQRITIQSRDELGALAQSFNQLSTDLVKAQDLRRQMTADIAHELRTPLSLILGHAEGLADGILPASRETFDIIYDEARRLTRLVDDLRTLSLSDAGELVLNRQIVAPGELLTAAAARQKLAAQAQKVELTVEVAPDLPEIEIDPDRLIQVLDNLINNALHHISAGGCIVLRAERDGAQVRLAVQDSGLGIAPEDLSRIFERFYRTDKSRRRQDGGSGLGLAIARSIIESHGGRIWAESVEGQGATFYITLPAAQLNGGDGLRR